jgi:serine/threonine protein kinase
MEDDNPPQPAAAVPLPARVFPPPTLWPAARNRVVNVVDHVEHSVTAYLQEDTNNPSRCYVRRKENLSVSNLDLPDKKPVPLGRHGSKGEIIFCQVFLRDCDYTDGIVFRRSDFEVVIKKIRRYRVDPEIENQRQGGPILLENPYNEIYVMQEYGNHENAMCRYDALYDKKYLYIVMLNVREGDLFHYVQRGIGGNEIPDIVKKLVVNLQYLQRHHLIHRDLKLENCVIRNPWIQFIDFAMTVQADVIEGEGQPRDVVYQGRCGTEHYISPEMHHVTQGRPFNYKCDLWAIGVTLWHLLTGMTLYDVPETRDWSFLFFIRMGGLTNIDGMNEVLDTLINPATREEACLRARLHAAVVLPAVTRNLLAKMLQENPAQRPSLEEILDHPFFQQQQG